jgi:hypothetical protein
MISIFPILSRRIFLHQNEAIFQKHWVIYPGEDSPKAFILLKPEFLAFFCKDYFSNIH